VTSFDPGSFREFEHEGWESIATRYHGGFSTVTIQSVTPLLDATRVAKGMRVLDIATGPGYVAAAAASRGAIATGVDFSTSMVDEARRHYPNVEFHQGDAEALSSADATFDAVMMNFGILHLARPEQAVKEAYRVLRPNGRFAFTVWDHPEKCRGFAIVLAAIQKHGDLNVPIPAGPPFFRFSDPEESTRVMTEAGFSGIAISHVPQVWRLPSAGDLFEVMYNASVRNAALLRAQKPEVLAKIREEIRGEVDRAGKQLAMPSVLAMGVKT
jgi:SAM-dependent methyltransferase